MTAEEAEKAPAWLGESTNIASDLQGKVEAELILMSADEVEKAPAWLGESTNIASDQQGKVEAELFLMTAEGRRRRKLQLVWASPLL